MLIVFFIGVFVPALGELTNLFSLGRVINFMPFFILGYYFCPEMIFSLKKKKICKIFAVIFLLVVGFVVFTNLEIITKYSCFLWQSTGYSSYPMEKIYCIIAKVFYYLIVSLIILALLILCPECNGILARIGANTLSIYLGHRVMRDVIYNLNIYQYFEDNSFKMLMFCIVVSVILTLVFGRKSLNRVCMLPFKILKKDSAI